MVAIVPRYFNVEAKLAMGTRRWPTEGSRGLSMHEVRGKRPCVWLAGNYCCVVVVLC